MVRLRESCSETVVGLDLMSASSTGPVFVKSVLEASLNFTYIATVTLRHIDNGVLQLMRKVMERVSPADFLRY